MSAERFRLPSLLHVALCFAVSALPFIASFAAAQDAPEAPQPAPAPEPKAEPAPPKTDDEPPVADDGVVPPARTGRAGRAAARAAERAAAAARAARGPAAVPPPDLTPPNVKPFETGIDYQPTSPSTRVTFNLEDADLPELVRMMSQITGRSFILPGKSRSIKATVYAPTKVTAAEAYQAFLSILELNGMALVPAGRYLKIVESGRVEGRAIPLYMGDEAVPTGDRFITRLQNVKNISSEDAASLLERFKSADGSLTAYAPTNMLIMTDTGTNIRRMLRILDVVDVSRTGEQIWVEPVHHANASDLASRLSEIFDAGGASTGGKAAGGATSTRAQALAARRAAAAANTGQPGGTPTATIGGGEARLTKILADERTNSLIIVATESAYLRILEMMKYLDVSMEGEGKIHVHHLQHSSAEEIASTLSSLVGKGGAPQAGGANADASASIFEGKVAVTAHKASNALVITSSMHDFAALKGVIDLLDSERKQVFIEAVIMELNVNRSNNLGLGYHGGIPDVPTNDSLSVVGFNAGRSIGGVVNPANGDFLTGLAVGVQGPTVTDSQLGFSIPGFGVALHALASSGDANVLSTPHLIASDNVQAEISVGENVPLQTSGMGGLSNLGSLAGLAGGQNANSALSALGGLGGLGALGGLGGGSVPRQDVGTTVQITPHLNDASEIRLEISEEISAAGAPDNSGNLGVRSISRTKAKTEVVVRDQQTVVIGGLMRDQVTTGQSKVPILGDIPLIGMLFRTNDKTKTKKNLLLFLTPYIIRTPDDLRAIYERKMRERQEFLDRYFVFNDSNYEAPIDYSRTRGLIAQMLTELVSLEEDRKLAALAAARPELKHEPRPAVGVAPESGQVISPDGEGGTVEQTMTDGVIPPPQVEPQPAVEQPAPPPPQPDQPVVE